MREDIYQAAARKGSLKSLPSRLIKEAYQGAAC